MKEERPSISPGSVVKPILEITGSVAAVVAYLQAIFKLVDTDFPNTLSLLTIVFTSVMVAGWRWGKLNQKKKKTSKNENSAAAKGTLLQRMTGPIRETKHDPYLLSLTRRRAEAGLIVVLTVFTVGWTGFNIQGVVKELTTDPSLTCNIPEREDKLRIIVADLLETNPQPPLLISDKVYEALDEEDPSGNIYQVCRLSEAFARKDLAEEAAGKYEADIFIWGRSDVVYEFHLEAPALKDPHKELSELSTEKASSVEFQLKEPGHISFLTQFALAELLLLNGQAAEAQLQLLDALDKADEYELPSLNFADPFFLLGLTYHPGYHLATLPNEEKAVEAYTKALENNRDLHAARLNRGVLLISLGRDEEALEDFTYLIDNDTPLKSSAYVNRSGLLMVSDPDAALRDLDEVIKIDPAEGHFFRGILRMFHYQDYPGAIEDFKKAVEYDPAGYYNYHLLGQAQLYAGEYEAAKETYVRIVPTLNEESRAQVIAELEDAAKFTSEIKPTVDEIVEGLNAAQLP